MCILFNRTTPQVFVTYLTSALYVHPLWFYKHQHDKSFRSKLFVACQRWWFQWRFWFVPSVPGYLRGEEEHKPDPWRNPVERHHMGLHLENEVAVVRTPTIISNNPVYIYIYIYIYIYVCVCVCFTTSAPEELLQAQFATWRLDTAVTNRPATSTANVTCKCTCAQ